MNYGNINIVITIIHEKSRNKNLHNFGYILIYILILATLIIIENGPGLNIYYTLDAWVSVNG